MPWFPEFTSALELARAKRRAAGQADPVGQYVAALTNADARAWEMEWPGQVVVYDPRDGEVRGRRHLKQFVRRSHNWLAEHHARVETIASTVADGRALLELMVHLSIEGRDLDWPVAVVAESADDRSVVFRSYFSRKAIDGQPHLRPAVLRPGPVRGGDVVGRYHVAQGAGDAEAIVATFESDGYYRGPASAHCAYRGATELRPFFERIFSSGGIGLEHCTVTDDGVRCAVEYNCLRWGPDDLTPQAGLGIYERGAAGLLAAVRVYDDVEPPATVR